MAIDYKRLLERLDNIQKEIEEIHQQLPIGLDEEAEVKAIKEEDDFRTLEEWQKRAPSIEELFFLILANDGLDQNLGDKIIFSYGFCQ